MNNKRWDALWCNAQIATMAGLVPYGLIEQGALAIQEGKIAWVGPMTDLPGQPEQLAENVFDAKGRCITPGLIDCHTHLVFGGDRAKEFEMRLQGVSYEEIARAGGGIRSTVNATRQISEEELFQQSLKRAQALLAGGVTSVEIKSGYGLDLATELKILRAAKKIGEVLPLNVFLTFLGAHAVPQEFQNRADDYINYVCDEMIPAIAKENLAHAVDVFCEKIAFNLEQTERVFAAAKKYNLKIKCHAEQLSEMGASLLAAKYHALSVDHLEFISEQGVRAIAQAKTVAVLLPGAFYFLREKQLPPIELFREHKVPIALATDCNPGTSPVTSLLLMINMACTLFRLTPEEAWLGVTKNAAHALGWATERGTLEVGKVADLVVWDVKHPVELAYYVGWNPGCEVWVRGERKVDS